MKKKLSVFLFLSLMICFTLSSNQIIIHQTGQMPTHNEHVVPADMPDVYYDDVTQTIIIDGGGEVNYYDVEIYPAYSAIPVITTQVSGTYDTIDVSSLAADDYDIIIYSPNNHQFEGEFTIE